jgi:hypothetical protein
LQRILASVLGYVLKRSRLCGITYNRLFRP